MSKVIVDDDLGAKLNGLEADVELCAPSGESLGFFVPRDEYVKRVYAWAKAEVSDEELQRISEEPGGRPLADIWKRLGVSPES
jgi:hypothetical protein